MVRLNGIQMRQKLNKCLQKYYQNNDQNGNKKEKKEKVNVNGKVS